MCVSRPIGCAAYIWLGVVSKVLLRIKLDLLLPAIVDVVLYTDPPPNVTVQLLKCITDDPAGDESDGIPKRSWNTDGKKFEVVGACTMPLSAVAAL